MTEHEQEIIDLKYQSPRFKKMNESDLSKWAKALLYKIHVITGWVIPDKEEYINILLDQFKKKMVQSYADMNPDEVEFAVRKYGPSIKDWGKRMNLSLIDEAIQPYLESRQEISHKEEYKTIPLSTPQKEDSSLSDVTMHDWYETTKKNVRAGNCRVEFIPEMLYDWLDKKGLVKLSVREKYEYLKQAAKFKLNQIWSDRLKQLWGNKHDYEEYKEMYDTGVYTGKYVHQLNSLAKKMIVWERMHAQA